MARYIYQGQTKDQNGKILTSATVSVYLAGTTTPASVYAASAGGVAVNSVVSSSIDGAFSFYVDSTTYTTTQHFKIVISKTSYTTRTVDDVVILPSYTDLHYSDGTYAFETAVEPPTYGAGIYIQEQRGNYFGFESNWAATGPNPIVIGGTVTAGNVVGINITYNSVAYTIRYTVVGGDTTTTIAAGLATAIQTALNVPATNIGATVYFNLFYPYASSASGYAGYTSPGASETVTVSALYTWLEIGPIVSLGRIVPGRFGQANDLIGDILVVGNSNVGVADTQYSNIATAIIDPTLGAADSRLSCTTIRGGLYLKEGLWLTNNVTGATPTSADMGAGTINIKGGYYIDGETALVKGGVTFPATQTASTNANTLDDYVEVSPTLTLTFTTPGDQSIITSLAYAAITKIGRVVVLQFDFLTTTFTHTTASGDILLTGIPNAYKPANTTTGTCAWSGITKANCSQINPIIGGGSGIIHFYASCSAQSLTSIGSSDMPSGGTVRLAGSITYTV